MSVYTEIDRIKSIKNRIRTKLVSIGLANSDSTLDDCATRIEEIYDFQNKTHGMCGYETISVQQHPDDPSQALITVPNQYGLKGYVGDGTAVTANCAGLSASNIRHGVTIGRYNGSSENSIIGTFTSDANATADKILTGYTAYSKGSKIVGTLQPLTLNGITRNAVVGDGQVINAGDRVSFEEGTIGGYMQIDSTAKSGWIVGCVEIENDRVVVAWHKQDGNLYLSIYDVSTDTPSKLATITFKTGLGVNLDTVKMIHLGDNRVFMLLPDYGNNTYVALFKVNGTTLSENTVMLVLSHGQNQWINGNYGNTGICVYDTNKICVSIGNDNGSAVCARIILFDVSVTNQINVLYYTDAVTSESSYGGECVSIGMNKILFICQGARDGGAFAIVGTVSGNTLSLGTPVYHGTYRIGGVIEKNRDKVVMCFMKYNRGSYKMVSEYAISGTTVTIKSANVTMDGGVEDSICNVQPIYGGGLVVFFYGTYSHMYITFGASSGYRSQNAWVENNNYSARGRVIQLYDGRIIMFHSGETSYPLYATVVSRPKVYKNFGFSGDAIALTGGTAGQTIQVSVPHKYQ